MYAEVVKSIKSLKNGKSAGHDMITSIILKNLPRKALVFIIKVINGIFSTGYFPKDWKLAKVIPIGKKGKDSSKICNYRPISLLPHLSKVVEKIIKSRLLKHVDKNNLIQNSQFGFRSGHSTIDQLARLINNLTKNFNDRKHTGALLLDVEKAFDTVWQYGLIYKLIKYNFPNYLVKVMFSYLLNRNMYVQINGVSSKKCVLHAGVPQGSVLGPILFIIFVNDAPLTKGVDESIFADDKMMFTSSYRISAITKRLQQALNSNKKFFHKWKIKLNDAKTEAIIITKRRPEIDTNIIIENQKIEWLNKIKYLGLVLDAKLTFEAHVKTVAQKAVSKLITLYPLLNRRSKISVSNKLLIYKVLVRPALLYASPVWSMISKCHYDKLQVVQNKFLRLIGNYRRYTQIKEMHKELEIEYVRNYIKKLSIDYFNKIGQHTNKLVKNINYVNKKYKHKRLMEVLYN